MASAYVPGLKISSALNLHLERRLPLKGQVVVEVGQKVSWDTVVAKAHLPGSVTMVNVAAKLGVEPAEVPGCLLKNTGDFVQKGEGFARNKGFFGYFCSTLEAPVSGTIESVSGVSGQVVIRAAAVPVEVKAYVDGTIEEVLSEEGVIVNTYGAFIQGIFGIGGESAGEIAMVSDDCSKTMTVADIRECHRGKIVVGGSLVSNDVIAKAIACGVKGIVVGGINDQDLHDFLGYDLGIAITGSEDKGVTLIITEGFGEIPMAKRTFALLKSLEGKLASISGATQIRAGVIRPEVIVPADLSSLSEQETTQKSTPEPSEGFVPGASVRLIREPHFGALATVVALPVELFEIPTGAKVRVAKVELADGEIMTVPRANVELLESE